MKYGWQPPEQQQPASTSDRSGTYVIMGVVLLVVLGGALLSLLNVFPSAEQEAAQDLPAVNQVESPVSGIKPATGVQNTSPPPPVAEPNPPPPETFQ